MPIRTLNKGSVQVLIEQTCNQRVPFLCPLEQLSGPRPWGNTLFLPMELAKRIG